MRAPLLLILVSIASASDIGAIGTLGARVGVPLGLSAAASAIVGRVDDTSGAQGVDGLVLMFEPGLGGKKFSAGYASIEGRDNGPYLIDAFRDWYHGSWFIWPSSGWSVRVADLRAGPRTMVGTEDARYIGVEGEVIGSFARNSSWGGLTGLNFTLGVFRRTDGHDDSKSNLAKDDNNEWLLAWAVGIGF